VPDLSVSAILVHVALVHVLIVPGDHVAGVGLVAVVGEDVLLGQAVPLHGGSSSGFHARLESRVLPEVHSLGGVGERLATGLEVLPFLIPVPDQAFVGESLLDSPARQLEFVTAHLCQSS